MTGFKPFRWEFLRIRAAIYIYYIRFIIYLYQSIYCKCPIFPIFNINLLNTRIKFHQYIITFTQIIAYLDMQTSGGTYVRKTVILFMLITLIYITLHLSHFVSNKNSSKAISPQYFSKRLLISECKYWAKGIYKKKIRIMIMHTNRNE